MTKTAKDAVYALVEATWPDVHTILSDSDADRLNWLKLVSDWLNGEIPVVLRTPFAVAVWGAATVRQDGGGVCNVEYHWPLSLVLVVTSGASRATEDLLHDRLEAMRSALLHYGGTEFQVAVSPTMDYSPVSDANQVMVKANLPFQCAEVTTALLIGEAGV